MHNLFHLWVYLQTQPLLWLTATLCVWELAVMIDTRAGRKAFTMPTVLAILLLVAILLATRTSYAAYFSGAQYVHFLLGPATVALAVPMYANLPAIRRHAAAIVISLSAGSIVAAASAMLIARALGATRPIIIALGPKSVTTPIAMAIAQNLGSQAPLAAVFVMITGMFGALTCTGVFHLARVRDWRAKGLAAGTAAHGIATARMLTLNETAGAFSGLAIGLNGLITSIALPVLLHVLKL